MSDQVRKDDFLITTTVDGKDWHWLWDHHEPMDIDHPAQWELHYNEGGVGAKLIHKIDKSEIEVRESHLSGEKDLTVPAATDSREFTLHFKKLQRIRPAYMPDMDSIKNVGPADHYASAGIREHLISFNPIEKKIHCRIEEEELFEIHAQPASFQVHVRRPGVRFKPHGQASRVLEPGKPQLISFAEMYGGAFVFGSYWWRINKVPTPEMMDLDELDREDAAQDVISLKQLGKVVTGFVAAAVVLLQGMHYLEIYQESHRKKPESVAVELKKPKLIQVVERPKPKPTPAPKVVKKPEPPKPVAKKPEPKKPEAPKKVAHKPQPKPVPQKIVQKPVQPKPQPKAPTPPKIAKVAPPKAALPVAPAPAKPVPVKPQAPDPSVIAAQQKAAVAKSLNFLSSGPSKAVNALATAPGAKLSQKYDTTGNGALPATNSALSAMAKSNTGGGPISTNSTRTVASNSGIKGGHGKGMNQVQGKVSLNALYGNGSGEALGAAMGGMSVSGPGSLSDADIEKTLARYLQKFQYCYEKALLTDSSLGGVVQIKWTIKSSGVVAGPSVVQSAMNNAGLHACLTKELAKITFPQPKGGEVIVKKPFKFEASAL